ncbi:MAG: substrate-binding domain-containing protein [Spirochaetales bacterium]|nr:substrate-binding domain-containing protein [Spirochaetales bacterium]
MIKKGLFICFSIILLLSCSAKKEKEDHTIRIGFSAASQTFQLERWNKDIKVFMNRAKELGAEVVFAKSAGDAEGQIPQIQYMLTQDIDILVVIPDDMEMLGGVIRKILDKGIPVLSYDRPIMGVQITGYVSFDNREVGRLLAKSLLSAAPKGNYLIVNGSIRDNNSFEVNKGVHEILDPEAQKNNIKIVNEIWLEGWSFDEALEKIGAIFNETTDIAAISCPNDLIASAAIRILSEKRMVGEVAIVGQDADLLACQRIVEGSQVMTVYKPISKLAERAAEIAVQMVNKEIPVPEKYMDNNSGKKIPFYVEQPIPVSKEQMDEIIIADGFHSKEDVYINITGQNCQQNNTNQ